MMSERTAQPGPLGRIRVVEALVGRIEAIDRRMSELAGERAAVLAALADVARGGAHELTHSDRPGRTLGRVEAEALARRCVIAEVATATRSTERLVAAQLEEAETLACDLPLTLAALRAGEVTHRQARVVVEETSDLDSETRAELERRLLLLSRHGDHVTLRRQARRERARLTRETEARRHRRAERERHVRVEHTRDGMTWLTAFLPTAQAAAIADRLSMTAAAHQHAGDERTLDQLRADAFAAALLVADCDCSRTPTGEELQVPSTFDTFRRITPSVTVTVPVLALLGHVRGPDGELVDPPELDGVGPIDAETARQLCGTATSFVRILTDPVTGAPVGIDEKARVPSTRLRAWLRYRDITCRHPGCSRPAIRCDIDHTRAFERGGPTCADNLVHLCRRHHRLKHTTRWLYAHGPSGHMRFTSSTGRRYDSPPPRLVLRT